jgi:hypothetical protein
VIRESSPQKATVATKQQHDPYPFRIYYNQLSDFCNQLFIEILFNKAPPKQHTHTHALSLSLTPTDHVHAGAQALTSHSVTPHPHSHELLSPPCFFVVTPALLLVPPSALPLLLHWSCSLSPLLSLAPPSRKRRTSRRTECWKPRNDDGLRSTGRLDNTVPGVSSPGSPREPPGTVYPEVPPAGYTTQCGQ